MRSCSGGAPAQRGKPATAGAANALLAARRGSWHVVYALIGVSVLVWAVLFGTGITLWWSMSRTVDGRVRARPGGPRHRAHP